MDKAKIYSDEQYKIARFAKALSHPVRVYILNYIASNTKTCCYSGDLHENLDIARSTLSEHLKELKAAGLIQGEINPPYIKYCINKENWAFAESLFRNFFKE
ncbi:MAG: helix-turn-helix transcriptional regulator [Lentimicrobiaceae bacterium]|nr:helix-turn-helix transcriptional regulator [Lentimicrobiaceae bacterium]MCB9024250.1 helix-turn-helix transcriptional regulator [Lentimicrobiaceae bacterium]MCO5265248.1 helix-turn-helix domain-containing protein [Lentimicrobium sp.]